MKNFRNAILGFVLALLAVIVFGAQSRPPEMTLESSVFFIVKCLPEALLAPLFFPLAMCYTGCGFSELVLGAKTAGPMSAFGNELAGALVRAIVIGLIFWIPVIVEALSPHHHAWEEKEG